MSIYIPDECPTCGREDSKLACPDKWHKQIKITRLSGDCHPLPGRGISHFGQEEDGGLTLVDDRLLPDQLVSVKQALEDGYEIEIIARIRKKD